jgi:hypothetical protein
MISAQITQNYIISLCKLLEFDVLKRHDDIQGATCDWIPVPLLLMGVRLKI